MAPAKADLAEIRATSASSQVFWQAGPERERTQIEGFLRRAVAAGALSLVDPRRGAEQFVSLVRGDIHLRQLLRLDPEPGEREIAEAAAAAADTFIRAFARR
jgi:TetR/AcrR family transcriptional repressor of mexJK operon